MSKVIIIGAGAAGLMAAYELNKAGVSVTVLEAQSYIGGRIHSFSDNTFSSAIELGAEFIHGHLPVTLELLEKAGVKYSEGEGSFWNANGGKLSRGYGGMRDWGTLEKALSALKEDITIDEFLDTYLDDEKHTELKGFVLGFAQGYDAADTSRASTFAFRSELFEGEESAQYDIDGGYGKLIDYLANECKKAGCEILTSTIAKEIKWSKGKVEIVTKGKVYTAERVIITIPAGILQLNETDKEAIKFTPAIPERMKAIQSIGYGNAMKVFLQFKTAFWQQDDFVKKFGREIKRLGFVVSDAELPTWWTQYPTEWPMLTGWVGGMNTKKFAGLKDDEIIKIAIDSLAYIFNADADYLMNELVTFKIADWANVPYIRGGYTYTTVEENKYRDILDEPIDNTLYFAGEAFYKGREMGTVEAALATGKLAAEKILASA